MANSSEHSDEFLGPTKVWNTSLAELSKFNGRPWSIRRISLLLNYQSINQSIHWHVQNAVIPCRSQKPLPFLPVIHFFVPLLSADHSSILPHFIQPSISWSTSWSSCFQIHIQYSFGNPIFFHSLYMSKPTKSMQPYCIRYSSFFNICMAKDCALLNRRYSQSLSLLGCHAV